MKVSVIIPTYNRAKLVQETIGSVLRQSCRDYEIIVIDDGSTDNTEYELERFSSEIIYIKQDNHGLNAARNRAIDVARGEYIALLDSDDLWREFKLALEISLLDAYPDIGFVFGDFYIMKPSGSHLANGLHTWFSDKPVWSDIFQSSRQWNIGDIAGSEEIENKCISVHFGDIYYTSLFGPRVLPSASLFRKSMVDGWLRFNDRDSYCGDWEFFAKLSRRHGAAFLEVETAFNRSHEDAVRLTRADRRLQIGNRLAMINALWKLDDDFYLLHKPEVDGELAKCWGQLLKLHLMAGDTRAAKRAASKLNKLNSDGISAEVCLYKMLAHIPGSPRMLSMLKYFLSMLRS